MRLFSSSLKCILFFAIGRYGSEAGVEKFQINITGSHTIARFGTMHLVAANIWTWIRYVLIEEGVMDREIRLALHY